MTLIGISDDYRTEGQRFIRPERSRPRGLTRTHRRAWWHRFNLLGERIRLVQVLTNIRATKEAPR